MKNICLLFLLSLFAFSCCKEDDNKNTPPKDDLTQLPPETQEGKNTFGCLVNGQVWRNQGTRLYDSNLGASYYKKSFQMSASKWQPPLDQYLAFFIKNEFTGKGFYKLNTNSQGRRFGVYSNIPMQCEYGTDSLNTGLLEITCFDTVNYIVSGRFSFTVATASCDTVRVTDGRFDIKYAY